MVGKSKKEVKSMAKKKEYMFYGELEWLILDKKDSGKTLIIAKEPVTYRNFHNKEGKVSWAESEIRKFLNEEFLKTQFTVEEQSRICPVLLLHELDWPLNREIQDAGKWTLDYLFLLSINEVIKYKLGKDYPFINEHGWWWTRSEGWHSDCIATVETKKRGIGAIYEHGMEAYQNQYQPEEPQEPEAGVRPAMWIIPFASER